MGERHPARVGEVRADDDMAEPDGLAKAPADLVGDAHQQEAGEEQVRLLEMAQVGQPDEDVEVQEDEAEVEPAGAPVPRAQHRPAADRVADVHREQQGERRPVGGDAEAQLLEDLDDAEDGEAGGAHRGQLHRMDSPRRGGAALGEHAGVEREARVGVGRESGGAALQAGLCRSPRTILRAAPDSPFARVSGRCPSCAGYS